MNNSVVYRKIPIISPGLIFVQKAVLLGLFSGELSVGLVIGSNFAFQNGLGLSIKTASSNSPWAYIRKDLLSRSEGYLGLRFGGGGWLIIGILPTWVSANGQNSREAKQNPFSFARG